MEGQWCTIESDPNIFRELAVKLGVTNVQFEEIIDFDFAKEALARHSRVYGFIFLFKWTGSQEKCQEKTTNNDLLFIKQNVTNSCATIAILHLAFNVPGIEMNDELIGFRDFVKELPADMRGMALTNSESIRTAHNSFISFGSINADQSEKDEDGDAFHFVALLPQTDNLLILDGMAEEPVIVAQSANNPIDMVIEYVKRRIGQANGEIRFSLLAMVPDLLIHLNEQLKNCNDESIKENIQSMIREEERRRRRVETPKPRQPERSEHTPMMGDLSAQEVALLAQALACASRLQK